MVRGFQIIVAAVWNHNIAHGKMSALLVFKISRYEECGSLKLVSKDALAYVAILLGCEPDRVQVTSPFAIFL